MLPAYFINYAFAQAGAHVFPQLEGEAGLPRAQEQGRLAVLVTHICGQGVRLHESITQPRLPSASSHRVQPSLRTHGPGARRPSVSVLEVTTCLITNQGGLQCLGIFVGWF